MITPRFKHFLSRALTPFLALALLCAAACQNDPRWYPDADVAIVSCYEVPEDSDSTSDVKVLYVTMTIHNTSSVAITSGAVTLKAVTTARTYLQTAALETRIIPDGVVALTVPITYLDPAETLAQDDESGVSVYASFFD